MKLSLTELEHFVSFFPYIVSQINIHYLWNTYHVPRNVICICLGYFIFILKASL